MACEKCKKTIAMLKEMKIEDDTFSPCIDYIIEEIEKTNAEKNGEKK